MAAPTPAELIELWKPIPKRRWWDTPGAVNVRDYPWDHYLGNNAGNWDTYCDWAEDTGHAEGYLYDCQASRRAFWDALCESSPWIYDEYPEWSESIGWPPPEESDPPCIGWVAAD